MATTSYDNQIRMYECEPNCQYCKNFNAPAIKRFWMKVKKTDNCWEWISSTDPNGYGKFSYLGKSMYAHRFSLSLVEQLKPGLEIDHLCRNRNCVNPKHLEQVDHRTNMIRSPIAVAGINNAKEYCIRGHKLSKSIIGVNRTCVRCSQIHRRKRYLAQRLANSNSVL